MLQRARRHREVRNETGAACVRERAANRLDRLFLPELPFLGGGLAIFFGKKGGAHLPALPLVLALQWGCPAHCAVSVR